MSWANLNLATAATPVQCLLVCLGGYLLGCFTSGYYLVRLLLRRDIRTEGSGNVGARNAGRLLGAPGFLCVLLLDFGKGALAVWLARRLVGAPCLELCALIAVTVGHIWPVQLRFRGGKGVAVSIGALLILDSRLALVFAGVCAVALLVMRNFTLGGLLAFALLPLAGLVLKQPEANVLGVGLLAGLIFFAHRKNLEEEIRRIAAMRFPHPKPEKNHE